MATSGQQQHKISPRKFSEKIALLNKKEAEGNAEFEEIIKEVQATRSHSAAGPAGKLRPTRQCANEDNDREALEEVFQNLIQCVGQYEEELRESQKQDLHPSDHLAGLPESQAMAAELARCKRSSSARLGPSLNAAALPQANLPLNQSPCVNLCPPFGSLHQPNQTQPYGSLAKGSNPLHTATMHNTASYVQAALPSCRARVTSFGSASNSRYNCLASQQQRPLCQDGWTIYNEMYLNPSCDRSWQKSCSDPTLHVPVSASVSANEPSNIVLCSEANLLAGNNMYVDADTNSNNMPITEHDQQENVGPSFGYVDLTQTASSATQNNNLNFNINDSAIPLDGQVSQCLLQQRQPSDQMPVFNDNNNDNDNNNAISHDHTLQGAQTTYNAQQSMSITRNNVPGIEIFSIDDDNNHLKSQPAVCSYARESIKPDSSLPDIANLQFGVDKSQHQDGFQVGKSEYQRMASDQYQGGYHAAKWASNCQHPAATTTTAPHLQAAKQVSSFTVSCPTGTDSALYVPKVNSLLSSSECGLTSTSQASGDFCNNIMMRSRSHSSIDHLAKKKMIQDGYANGCGGAQPAMSQHQHPNPSLAQQHNNYINQLCLQTGKTAECCGSNTSMKPHRGSVSPIDSTSSLASPQSEQNSPGSSTTTEYGELLPFAAASTQRRPTCEFIDENNNGNSDAKLMDQIGPYFAAQEIGQTIVGVNEQQQQNNQSMQTPCYKNNPYGQQQTTIQDQFSVPAQTNRSQESVSSIGPCQSPSSSRRLHNQACRGAYTQFSHHTRCEATPSSEAPLRK